MDNTQEKPVSFFRFEDLRIYAKATDYSTWIINNIGQPEDDMQRNLVNSLCHSSYDIALNIAEGSSRNKNQFEHYLKISKSAIRECIVFTAIAANIGLFDEERCNQSREYLMELTRMIGALIISLQRGSSRRRDEYETEETPNEESNTSDIDSIDTDF
ncbi:MAG: four helix bundle protein [Bacteroidales bacterium]|nr:four helix bundle protein [Bacteroidales bacterium]